MSDLPQPLTPADCDLRGLPFMPLDVVRLIDSDLFAISSGDEFKAAVALWCKSWIQLPAASLPDDDRVLSHLSGAGVRWKKIREMALKGWVKCSDGRLYHPVISEKACHAWKARIAQKERAAKRWNKQNNDTGNAKAGETVMPDECRGISRGNARERERESKDISSLRSDLESCSPSAQRAPKKTDPHGTRLPKDWEPTDEMRAFALSLNLNPTDISEQFRDYWLSTAGAKGRKADWFATWRGWCRREAERKSGAKVSALHGRAPTRQERVNQAWSNAPKLEDFGL